MKIKRQTKIEELSHEDLVNLFSTALYGNPRIGCDYDKDFYNTIPVGKVNGDCYEDKIADVLLNGGKIYLYDEDADGQVYGNRGEVIEDDNCVMYPTTLEDVKRGLENAFNGTFNFSFDADNEKKYAMECAEDLYDEDSCNLDLTEADVLLQIIMFNEIIYG